MTARSFDDTFADAQITMGELRPLLSPGETALTRLLTRMCSETAEQVTHPHHSSSCSHNAPKKTQHHMTRSRTTMMTPAGTIRSAEAEVEARARHVAYSDQPCL